MPALLVYLSDLKERVHYFGSGVRMCAFAWLVVCASSLLVERASAFLAVSLQCIAKMCYFSHKCSMTLHCQLCVPS